MPTPTATLDDIRTDLLSAVDPAYRDKIAVLVPTGATILGVRVPAVRALALTWHRAHKELSPDAALDLLAAAFKRRCREELLFAIVLLSRLKKKLDATHLERLDPLVDGIEDWEVCDQLSMNVIGEIVAADLGETARLEAWARSGNPWRRRAAVASTTALTQKGRAHVAEALAVCRHVTTEKDTGVKKAVGWALREASEKDAAAVHDFLMGWKGKAERRILNEGSQKLAPARRKALLD
jgi:3-methyladenine DNA glycosylase AlkD